MFHMHYWGDDLPKGPRRRRVQGHKPAPTRAQLKALEDHREHISAVKNTHPQLIRAPMPSRVTPLLSDEDDDF